MVHQSVYIFAARAANAASQLGLALVISRVLGAEALGLYAFLAAATLTASYVSNWGLDAWMVRRLAPDATEGPGLLRVLLKLKIVLSLGAIAALILLFRWTGISREAKQLLPVFSLTLLFNSVAQSFWFYGDAFQKLQYHAGLWAASNLLKAGFAISGTLMWGTMQAVVAGLVVGEGAALALSWFLVRRLYLGQPLVPPHLTRPAILREAAPVAGWLILSAAYFRVDSVLLELLRGEQVLGWYSASYKVIEALTVLPSSVMLSAFPALSREGLGSDFKRALSWLASLGALLSVVLYVGAETLIAWLYGGGFQMAVPALRILAPAVFFLFLNTLWATVLISLGHERWNLGLWATALLINIVLNLILIPRLDHVGAAVSTLASDALLFVGFVAVVRTITSRRRDERTPTKTRSVGYVGKLADWNG